MTKQSNLKVRKYREEDKDVVMPLHKDIFLPIDVTHEFYQKALKLFEENIRNSRVLVAEFDGEFAGFAGYLPLGESEERFNEVKNALGWFNSVNANVDNIKYYAEHLHKLCLLRREEIGRGEIVVEFYPCPGKKLVAGPEDIYFSEIAVDPAFRRRGVGRELTLERIKAARATSASAVYVACWEGGYASTLNEKLGFFPILKFGPIYNDGEADQMMGLFLK